MADPRALLDAYVVTYPMNRAAHELAAALRAVLDLHKPWPDDDPDPDCSHCRDDEYPFKGPPYAIRVPWPCPTVTAITEALEAARAAG